MIPRILEPEVMDSAEEAADYDAMDHATVNRVFVDDLFEALGQGNRQGAVLDVGTGTALIPLELTKCGFAGTITGVDLADSMLRIAHRNVERAGAANIRLEQVDAKRLPYADGTFDVVMSNSIVHHIPEPAGTLAEMHRVLRAGGLLFVRDLLRPATTREIEQLVEQYAGDESARQQQLFRQSLHASLTALELAALLPPMGIDPAAVAQSSDRHWTLCWRRPGDVTGC